jgi:peptide/nickel transport system ATP-binding protein
VSNIAPLLSIKNLSVDFHTRRGRVQAVRGVSADISASRALGLVGESGCGKSVTSAAIMGLIQLPGEITGGDITWKGQSLIAPGAERYRRDVCGNEIAIVFQDPMTSFNPILTIGAQIEEVIVRHVNPNRPAAKRRAVELLDLVKISEPHHRVNQYPFELSGGMRQRALIAMALASEPELLIADEPTTALDVTVQATILDLIKELQQALDLAVLLITHDLGVVASLCHEVAVMYAGGIVEQGTAEQVLSAPRHPYSEGLLQSTPRLDSTYHRLQTIDGQPPDLRVPAPACAFMPRCYQSTQRCEVMPAIETNVHGRLACWHPVNQAGQMQSSSVHHVIAPKEPSSDKPLLSVNNLSVHYPLGASSLFGERQVLRAVDGVSFDIFPGETLGLVGESGSGKTTTGRAVLQNLNITGGSVHFQGQDITGARGEQRRLLRRNMQLIFQDPYSSLNPRMTIVDIVSEPLIVHGIETHKQRLRERVVALLDTVGLPADAADRHPHAFSGGQRQRIGIARALALQPAFIVADEPVSALDVSIRAQVVNLMQDIQLRTGVAFLFIAHDLAIVRHIADRVAIMKQGKIVEIGPSEKIYTAAEHEYTRTLLASVPNVDRAGNYRQ